TQGSGLRTQGSGLRAQGSGGHGTAFTHDPECRRTRRAPQRGGNPRAWQRGRATLDSIVVIEARYRRLVELSPDGILIVQDDRIALVNPEDEALLRAAAPHDVLA